MSVDDFGTGYTSLALLKEFRFDELKIDRSFISGVRTDQNDSAIVRSVLGLGHLLGLDVVAEGVEDGETANWLAEIGCDVLQGFHFARPVPPTSLEAAFNNSGQLGEGRVRYMSEQGRQLGEAGAVPLLPATAALPMPPAPGTPPIGGRAPGGLVTGGPVTGGPVTGGPATGSSDRGPRAGGPAPTPSPTSAPTPAWPRAPRSTWAMWPTWPVPCWACRTPS